MREVNKIITTIVMWSLIVILIFKINKKDRQKAFEDGMLRCSYKTWELNPNKLITAPSMWEREQEAKKYVK